MFDLTQKQMRWMTSRSRPIGRYLPSTISLNERLLIAVGRSKAVGRLA